LRSLAAAALSAAESVDIAAGSELELVDGGSGGRGRVNRLALFLGALLFALDVQQRLHVHAADGALGRLLAQLLLGMRPTVGIRCKQDGRGGSDAASRRDEKRKRVRGMSQTKIKQPGKGRSDKKEMQQGRVTNTNESMQKGRRLHGRRQ
jgi:hypothetical protein